jgi:hypothetical protein
MLELFRPNVLLNATSSSQEARDGGNCWVRVVLLLPLLRHNRPAEQSENSLLISSPSISSICVVGFLHTEPDPLHNHTLPLRRANAMSRNGIINKITLLRWHQEVVRWRLRQLPLLCPLSNSIKILALVWSVEIDKRGGCTLVPPDLAKETRIRLAHQLLPDYVETVSCCEIRMRVLEYKRDVSVTYRHGIERCCHHF